MRSDAMRSEIHEAAQLADDLGMSRGAQLVAVPPSDQVDAASASGMLAAVRGLASGVTVHRVGDSERISRAGYAADAARDLRDLIGFLNPYAPGSGHNRVADMHTAATSRSAADQADAAERLALADQHH